MNSWKYIIVGLFVALTAFQTQAEDIKEREMHVCDPVATAKWLTSLYSLQKGKLVFCAEHPNRLRGQIPLAAKAKVSSGDDGLIIIDQERFLPVGYANKAGYEFFSFTTPLTYISPANLDNFVPYGKDVAVSGDPTLFRTLGKALHSYFTSIATKKPEHYRVEDVLGYPTDFYIWDVGGSAVFLKAYKRNDNHGLSLRICSREIKPGRDEIARQRSRIAGAKPSKQKRIFQGWDEPLKIKTD